MVILIVNIVNVVMEMLVKNFLLFELVARWIRKF